MMNPRQAAAAKRALDAQAAPLRAVASKARPSGGWIRAIRESRGMSGAQLGRRLGITRQAVQALERSETDGGVRLSSLQRTAEAMGCTLVYAFVPNEVVPDEAPKK